MSGEASGDGATITMATVVEEAKFLC